MSTTPTRRILQLTQRYMKHGMTIINARKKAVERANFEQEIEDIITNDAVVCSTLSGR